MARTVTMKWGFCDLGFNVAKLTDLPEMISEAATLKPDLIRLDCAWNYIAKKQDPGTATFDTVNNVPTTTGRDWSTLDRCVNDLLLTVGCDIILMIGQGKPSWGGWIFGIGAHKGDHTDYGSFCAEVAARYKIGGPGIRTDGKYAPNATKGVLYYEFWNEENNLAFWGGAVDASGFTQYVIAGNAGIKSVLPGAQSVTIFGGMQHVPRSAPWIGGGVVTQAEITFLTRCYAAAVKQGTTLGANYDLMAEHIYPQTDTTNYGGSTKGPAPDPNTDNLLQLVAIRNLMVAQGDGAKKIIITECGFSTNVVTEAQQSSYMQTLFGYLDGLGYIYGACIYNLRNTGTSKSYVEHNWGMEDFTFNHKAIWSWLLTLTAS
jgi:hypothetical protein